MSVLNKEELERLRVRTEAQIETCVVSPIAVVLNLLDTVRHLEMALAEMTKDLADERQSHQLKKSAHEYEWRRSGKRLDQLKAATARSELYEKALLTICKEGHAFAWAWEIARTALSAGKKYK